MMKDKLEVNIADFGNIKCRTCIYSIGSGVLSNNCCKFKNKPRDVYYENADCPEYQEKPKFNN